MSKDDILVVKLNAAMPTADFEKIRNLILSQKESGVILLPFCCTAQIIPKDIEIKVEK